MLRRDEFDPPQTLNLVRRAQMAGSGWEESPLPQPRGVTPPRPDAFTGQGGRPTTGLTGAEASKRASNMSA